MGVSKGGVSVISKSESARCGRLDQSQIEVFLARIATDESGVAVVTRTAKKKSTNKNG